jgi:signal transduction histidine kinase
LRSEIHDEHSGRRTRPLKYSAKIAAIAILYVLAARAGLQLDAISGFATLVWPPSGIALAALLLGGYQLWPGIFLGALIANVLTGAPPLIALGIAAGNTLEPLLAAYALTRLPRFRLSLDCVRDAVAFILIAAGLSTVVSATVGVTSLYLGGLVARDGIALTWRAWWLGDAIGVLLVAPVLLAWASREGLRVPAQRVIEAAALAVATVIGSLFVFVFLGDINGARVNEAYFLYPLLIWAAIRFGLRGAVSATFVVSVIAIWGTAAGHGPFVHSTLHWSLFALQTFMGLTAATFLVLGASTSEREHSREELLVAHDTVARANKAKAEFLAVMSHELRTPLNAIAGYAEILALGVVGSLTDKQSDAITRIRRNQQHLLGLIDDVLSFARIEAGTTTIKARPVRITEAFDAIEPLLQPDLLHKQIDFEQKTSDPGLELQADPAKLRQILLNIVGNAIKFTPSGGRVRLTASHAGKVALITVTDTGIGVAPDKISAIFDPFYQVDTGTTREYPGVGLGLAIARDLVRAMAGEIYFDSTLGKGSVVSITLPLASEDDNPQRPSLTQSA